MPTNSPYSRDNAHSAIYESIVTFQHDSTGGQGSLRSLPIEHPMLSALEKSSSCKRGCTSPNLALTRTKTNGALHRQESTSCSYSRDANRKVVRATGPGQARIVWTCTNVPQFVAQRTTHPRSRCPHPTAGLTRLFQGHREESSCCCGLSLQHVGTIAAFPPTQSILWHVRWSVRMARK